MPLRSKLPRKRKKAYIKANGRHEYRMDCICNEVTYEIKLEDGIDDKTMLKFVKEWKMHRYHNMHVLSWW